MVEGNARMNFFALLRFSMSHFKQLEHHNYVNAGVFFFVTKNVCNKAGCNS